MGMGFDTILCETTSPIAEIRFNRPHRLNALTRQSYAELSLALDAAETDPEVRAILIAGEGRAFSVGADLKEDAASDTAALAECEQALARRLTSLGKPIIAAVHGYALGAGAELAIACDFLLMAETARFGLPEIAIGNFLGGGATQILPRLVGLAKARELVFLGERIDAAEAVRIGLANRRFADQGFLEQARAFAVQLAGKAPLSMRLAKEQLNRAAERSFDQVLTAELEGMQATSASRDWQEGMRAVAERRPPVFQGQ